MIAFNNIPITIKQFPNGESILDKKFFFDHLAIHKRDTLTLKYESDADFFQLLLIRKALWFPIDLHIPYFPYSRMDRKSDDYVFTLKSVCKFINWLDFANVYIYEPHSDVTPALLNHCKIVDLISQLLAKTDFDKEEDVVLFPDAGAYKKYATIVNSPNELIAIKSRDFKTGRILKVDILGPHLAKNKRVFIVDDLCSKGGTFIRIAEVLKEYNPSEVILVVAHCEDNIFRGDIFGKTLIDRVVTTNTIIDRQRANGKLTIFDWSSLC